MKRTSAGILLHRKKKGLIEVFLVHPGGPFFANKDAGAWSIPKGEVDDGEDALAAAQREFEEETGCVVPQGSFIPLGQVRQKSGKVVLAWAAAGDCDADAIVSNTFTLEWPPESGRVREFPEVDRAGWFTLQEARQKINPAQAVFLDELMSKI